MKNKIQSMSLLYIFIFFFACKSIEKQYSVIEIKKNIMSDTTNMKKLYSKIINDAFEIELNRKADKTYCFWEINLVGSKEKRTIKKDSLLKDEIENKHFRLMHHPRLYDTFQILDAIHDQSTNRLFLLIDRLGEIVLYQYAFDGKTLISITQQDKIHVTTYLIRRQDVELMLASDAKIYPYNNQVLTALRINLEDEFLKIDLNDKTTKSLIFDSSSKDREIIKDEDNHEFIFIGNIENEKKTSKVLKEVLEKSNYADQPCIYHFFMASPKTAQYFEKEGKRLSTVLFFTTINGNEKVMIYKTSAAKEWTIIDYQELSEGEN